MEGERVKLHLYVHLNCRPACLSGPLQSALRSKLGEETTAFDSITDGAHTISKGDVVRVNAKPQVVGRVLYFTIPQVNKGAGGQATGTLWYIA